ncbi:MAG: nuclear transport factor 2 family protein [Sediminibacterium sp.]|nr:nuclear transport factor 2 family protein [Sediminibacterium sp.]
MKRSILLLIALFIFNSLVNAQHASDSVKATINSLFEAMLEANGAKLKQCFTDSAVLQTITKDKAGLEVVKNDGVLDFVKQINAIPKGLADERIVFGVVKVDGPLAIVWAPYKFYKNGVFSHCGVNSFQLVRLNQQWKIQYLIDTRRKDNCAE